MAKQPYYTAFRNAVPINSESTITNMTATYNRLPGASHFLPYGAGPNINLHFSYTASSMYCKRRVRIDNDDFEYVEVRELDDESKSLLDAMSVDDYVGPASQFNGLSGDERTMAALDEAFRRFRLVADERSRLRKELSEMEVDTDEHQDIECQLEFVGDEASEVVFVIEQAVDAFNRASGYDPKTGAVALAGQ